MLRRARIGLGAVLAITLAIGLFVALRPGGQFNRTHVTAYFANSTGIYPGDEVRILGIPVGKIDSIQPDGMRVKVGFWYDKTTKVPSDAKAVILSPSVVPARAIQLTPAYAGGAVMTDGAVIPQERTAVPVEWDDFRKQLEKLTATLQPTEPGGVSTLGGLINTAADNLRGQGANIRETLVQLSQTFSVLGDHSDDIFSTVKNLSILVSALQNSADVIRRLNVNLSATTRLLANDPDEVANAVRDVDGVVGDLQTFIAANRESLGIASDKLASVGTTVVQSLDDLKQTLHIAPNTVQNFINIYHPAQGAISGAAAINQFSNPISFLCGAIQAASRLNAEQSSKLCVQYLAPIIKNRQYNFPPLGFNPFVGATARPNEVTYSEDWLRPDYMPPPAPPAQRPPSVPNSDPTDPTKGLPGMMMPPGSGK